MYKYSHIKGLRVYTKCIYISKDQKSEKWEIHLKRWGVGLQEINVSHANVQVSNWDSKVNYE